MTAERRHPLIPPRAVDARQELPALELEVLARWRERGVFAESLRRREGAPEWVFYEGPPTANGPPGSHHVLSRVFKDIYPRYKTMRGYRVQRKGGWDCHGLPVEIAVEQELGISSKAEIERYGIERFNARCRESVFAYLEEWDRLTERIGFWVDLDGAYRTLDESYIESVWWALAEIDRKGWLYEGHKVVPYCPRCGTALSSHEVALGYEDVVDPSVYVRLPIRRPVGPLRAGDELLIWTTTPWTLPGNVAVAVGPDIEYARVRWDGHSLIVASALVEQALPADAEVVDRFLGREIVGRRIDGTWTGPTYEGPIFALSDRAPGDYPILAGDFVTTDDGTGLVHIAPAFGEDDFKAAASAGLFDPTDPGTLYNPVRPDGTYDGRLSGEGGESFEGLFVKDAATTEALIATLEQRDRLLAVQDHRHSYPHCWRCGTPLIYYAKPSWYIATSRIRDRMLAANETVAWHPPHIKHGRFGDWLSNNVDWALSRERYWGTPLPVWRCDERHRHTVGSFAELQRLSGQALSDHHRPFVDDIRFACTRHGCKETMRRVPEVIDVWFDSGAMPFAQHHTPFADARAGEDPSAAADLRTAAERFAGDKSRFPADFICEALDQTRGWFYSLLAVSTLLFDTAPYENVVCLGLILDAEGQKMSKSRGNTVEPWQVLDTYGADAFRWYFFTSKQPWDGYRFSIEAIGDGVRLFLKQLWSTYFFYVLYAHANREALADSAPEPAGDLDRWALSRAAHTAELVAERLDDFDATAAGRAIAALVDDLSNWYVRRSRRRFWDGEGAAFATLRECLLIVARLLAPFCPFVADEIYDNLDGELPSVHLCNFPAGEELPARDEQLEAAMATARETVRLGLGARARAKIKVRQPLAEAVVVADGAERAAIERLGEIVRDELNVRAVRFVAAADELGSYELKANYRKLGPLFGKEMPLAAEAIAALDPSAVAAAVLAGAEGGGGEGIGISVGGREHTLSAEDVLLTMQPPEGYSVEREGSHAVALDLTIDGSLLREGRSREIVHAVQNARKTAGLQVEDRIELLIAGDAALIEAAREHERYLSGETLAVSVQYDGERGAGGLESFEYSERTEVEGLALQIALGRV